MLSSSSSVSKSLMSGEDQQKERLQHYLPEVIIEIVQSYNSDELLSDNLISKSDQQSFISSLNLFGMEKIYLAAKAVDLFLWGCVDQAISMIETFPHLLMVTVERVGPSGAVRDKLYGAALFTDDRHVLDEKGNSAIGRIKNLLIKHYGEEEEQKQYNARFLKTKNRDWEEEEKVKVQTYFTAFDLVCKEFDEATAISEEELKNDLNIQAAIQNFQLVLTAIGVSTSGKCCISQLWDYAAKFYNAKKCEEYGGTNSHKNILFCQKILGAIDSRLPAWGMQVLNHGIYFANEYDQMVMRVNVRECLEVFSQNSLALGNNFFISSVGGAGACDDRAVGSLFSTFVDKQQSKQNRSTLKLQTS